MKFQEFLAKAKPGQRYLYHAGLLMKDRQMWSPIVKAWVNNALHYDALMVWKAYEAGRVYLVQEKKDGTYYYFAVKRGAYRPRVTRSDNRPQELFGSFSGSRPFRQSSNRYGTLAGSRDRTVFA